MKLKLKILFFFIFFVIAINCIAQEIPNPYVPEHWQSFTELSSHLSDTTKNIGRLYQYSNKELYFKDSDGVLSQVTNQLTNELLYYTPETYGAEGDGVTDDTDAFITLIAVMGSNDAVVYLAGTYYLNTAGGLTFTNKVKMFGPGKFIIGSGVGNSPAITISGERSYLSDFEIVGDHTNFVNAVLTTELRRNIQITADYVICENLKDTNSIVGIELNAVNFCTIKDCSFVNTIIEAGDGTNNYHVGVWVNASSKCKIISNYFSGHGNPVLHGGASYYNIINCNDIYNADNNGIYISSGQWVEICGNNIRECDGNGIKARDSYHLICNNLIDQNSYAGGLIGIGVTGNGTPDSDGFNGENTLVIGNVVRGRYTGGIRMNDQDNGFLKNPHFCGNTIELEGDANFALYGIHIKGRTQNAVITGNSIKNSWFGIYFSTDDPNNDYHQQAIVANNSVRENGLHGIIGTRFEGSTIAGNIVTGYGTPSYGIYVLNFGDANTVEYTSIKDNYIKGTFNTGIYIGAISGYSLKNIKVDNNEIELSGTTPYGIRIPDTSTDLEITHNSISGHDIGIYIYASDPNTETHTKALIQGNDTSAGTNDGIVLAYMNYSLITDNVSMNAAANRSGITMADCNYCVVMNNNCSDNQGTPTQKFGIEEQGTSDNNIFINNYCENNTSYRYVITGTSSIVKTEQMIVETLSGARTFEIGEAKTYVIDPGGAARNFNPRAVTWPMINELILINTADNAETITFDSLGLNQAVAQNERGIFVYDGSNWLKVYVGS
jgi:hypothetical protein